MKRILITVLIGINLFYLAFAQDTIGGRWHLVGYEDNVMYQFEDNYRYSIYSEDGTFGSIEDGGGTPNPYTVVEDTITIDLFFGNIVNYQMNFMCDGQVVEFKNIDYETIHSTHFREGYDYEESPCNHNSTLCDNDYIEINGDCYYQSDLNVLQSFIDLNQSLNGQEPLGIGDQEWNNTRLTYLGLGNRSLTTIPDNIGDLNYVEYLFLSSNQFSILPEGIGDLSSLKFLFLSHNQFSILPESIGSLSNLETLYLHDNQLNILPQTICNLSDCYIYVNDNQLCPPYPECIEEDVGYQDTTNCEPACDLGDVNCDGDLNVLDIVLMVNMILDGEYDSIADINEDNIVDILDIVRLVNIILDGADTSTVTDIDGNVYETVQIDEQLWMAENLKVSHYNDGSEIPTGYSNPEWGWLDMGAYGVYVDDPVNTDVYGNLYNWYTVDDDRGVCPDGWHIPSDEEFMELEMFLGMSESEANSTGYRGTNEGSKLAGRHDLWNSGSLDENQEFGTSGFSGFPAGNRDYYNANYNSMGSFGAFWSSTELNSLTAWNRELEYHASVVYRFNATKQFGFSIRCLKD